MTAVYRFIFLINSPSLGVETHTVVAVVSSNMSAFYVRPHCCKMAAVAPGTTAAFYAVEQGKGSAD